MERNWQPERAYMNGLLERLAGEDFCGRDAELPDLLRALSVEEVKARKFGKALALRRAALLLENARSAREGS